MAVLDSLEAAPHSVRSGWPMRVKRGNAGGAVEQREGSALAGRRVEDLEAAAGKEDDERGRRKKRARGGRLARRPHDGCHLPVRWSDHGGTTTPSTPAGGLLLRPLHRPERHPATARRPP